MNAMPRPRAPKPSVLRYGTLAPAPTPAVTPREPSPFITTTDQPPDSTSQVSEREPWATQMSCAVGGPGAREPRRLEYVTLNGANSRLVTRLEAEPRR